MEKGKINFEPEEKDGLITEQIIVNNPNLLKAEIKLNQEIQKLYYDLENVNIPPIKRAKMEIKLDELRIKKHKLGLKVAGDDETAVKQGLTDSIKEAQERIERNKQFFVNKGKNIEK